MEIQCPHCQTSITATPEQYGLNVNCPECNGQFTIPDKEEEGGGGGCAVIIVILALLAFCGYFFPGCFPTGVGFTQVPVKASIRRSYINGSLVATISNPNWGTIKGLKITCTNPKSGIGSKHSCRELKQYDTYEVGWVEGWSWGAGDELTVAAYGYRSKAWVVIGRSFMLKSEYEQKLAEQEQQQNVAKNTIAFWNKLNDILRSYLNNKRLTVDKKKYSNATEELKADIQSRKALADKIKGLDAENIDRELLDWASDYAIYQYKSADLIQNFLDAKTAITAKEAAKESVKYDQQEISLGKRLVELEETLAKRY